MKFSPEDIHYIFSENICERDPRECGQCTHKKHDPQEQAHWFTCGQRVTDARFATISAGYAPARGTK